MTVARTQAWCSIVFLLRHHSVRFQRVDKLSFDLFAPRLVPRLLPLVSGATKSLPVLVIPPPGTGSPLPTLARANPLLHGVVGLQEGVADHFCPTPGAAHPSLSQMGSRYHVVLPSCRGRPQEEIGPGTVFSFCKPAVRTPSRTNNIRHHTSHAGQPFCPKPEVIFPTLHPSRCGLVGAAWACFTRDP